MTAGELESVLGESDAVDEFAQRARTNWPLSTLFVSICRFFALLTVGRLDDADALSHTGLELALTDPAPFGRVYWTEALGLVALTRGHLDDAEMHLDEVVALMRPADNGTLRLALCELAMVYALRGDGCRRGEGTCRSRDRDPRQSSSPSSTPTVCGPPRSRRPGTCPAAR